MKFITELIAPILMSAVCVAGLMQKRDVYSALCDGAKKGLGTTLDILPALLALFPAIYLFRASGLPELLEGILGPVFAFLGIPAETGLLVLLRPFSGSAALSAAAELIETYGPDSLIGRTAAVMCGASETSLYVAAVYFSAAGIKDSRWTIPAALCADLACFVAAGFICRLLWG